MTTSTTPTINPFNELAILRARLTACHEALAVQRTTLKEMKARPENLITTDTASPTDQIELQLTLQVAIITRLEAEAKKIRKQIRKLDASLFTTDYFPRADQTDTTTFAQEAPAQISLTPVDTTDQAIKAICTGDWKALLSI